MFVAGRNRIPDCRVAGQSGSLLVVRLAHDSNPHPPCLSSFYSLRLLVRPLSFVRSFVRSSASFFSVSFDFLPLESSVPSMPLDKSLSFFFSLLSTVSDSILSHSSPCHLFPFEMFWKERVSSSLVFTVSYNLPSEETN